MKNRMLQHRTVWIVSLCLAIVPSLVSGVTLRVGVVRGFPGNTVEVPMSLVYRSNEVRNVVALQADVLFDAGGISDGNPVGDIVAGRHTVASSLLTRGVRRLLLYSSSNDVLTNGFLARIPITVGANAFRNFSLTLSNVILVRGDAAAVPSASGNGFVGVNQVFLAPDGHADGFLNVPGSGAEQCYLIQATTDFRAWVDVQTHTTEGVLLQFNDPDANEYPRRFYRAIVCDATSGVRIATITQLSGGEVKFEFAGLLGQDYIIQGSTNLTAWRNIRTNSGLAGLMQFTEAMTNHTRHFFRVRVAE